MTICASAICGSLVSTAVYLYCTDNIGLSYGWQNDNAGRFVTPRLPACMHAFSLDFCNIPCTTKCFVIRNTEQAASLTCGPAQSAEFFGCICFLMFAVMLLCDTAWISD